LLLWVDFQQNSFLRLRVAQQQAAHLGLVFRIIGHLKIRRYRIGDIELPTVGTRLPGLKSVERWKALHLNQLRLQLALRIAANSKIKRQKRSVRVLIRHPLMRRNCGLSKLLEVGALEHFYNVLARLHQLIPQLRRHENRGFGQPKFQLTGQFLLHIGHHGFVFFGREGRIVSLAKNRNHYSIRCCLPVDDE